MHFALLRTKLCWEIFVWSHSSLKSDLGAMGEDAATLDEGARGECEVSGDFSSSEAAGLGGREACIISSSFSIQAKTLDFSDIVIFWTAWMTLSRGLSVLLASGDEWQEEEEEGEGVSLRLGTREREDSMLGLSVVMILDTAIRLGGKEAREK